MERLDGQVAIVTGGARGIGAGIARVLREEGATLMIADRDESAAPECATSLDPPVQMPPRSPSTSRIATTSRHSW